MFIWRPLVLFISNYFSIIFSVYMNNNSIFKYLRWRNLRVILDSFFFFTPTSNLIANYLGFPPKTSRDWPLIGSLATTLFQLTIISSLVYCKVKGDLLVFKCHGLLFAFPYFSIIGPTVYLYMAATSVLLKRNQIMSVLLWKLSNTFFFHSET